MLGGGFVTGIIYSPTQQNLIYARTDIGGAYRWDAANKIWIPLSDSFASSDDYGVVSMATDPSNPNRVYMATGLYTQSWGATGAVYSSTDKGATWARNSLSIKLGGNENGRSAGERLQVDPNLGSILFLGSSTDGLWKSTNYGTSWSKVSSFPVGSSPVGSGGISFVLFDKSSSSSGTATKTIYVGVMQTGTNLYKSTDGGATWTAVSGQPTNLMPHQAARASSGIIYLSYSDASGPNNVGAGAVWKLNPASNAWTNISPPAGQGGYGGISVDAQNANHVIVSTLGRWWPRDEVLRTTDGGSNWTGLLTNATWDHTLAPYAASMNPHWLGDVEIDPFNAGNAWFVTGYGVYNSNNLGASPANWIFQNKGLEETAALELISPPSGAPLLSALGILTVSNTTTWTFRRRPVAYRLNMAPISVSILHKIFPALWPIPTTIPVVTTAPILPTEAVPGHRLPAYLPAQPVVAISQFPPTATDWCGLPRVLPLCMFLPIAEPPGLPAAACQPT